MGEYLFVNVSVMNLWSSIVFSSLSDLTREKRMGVLGSNFASPVKFQWIYGGKVIANLILALWSFAVSYLIIQYVFDLNIVLPNVYTLITVYFLLLISFTTLSLFLSYFFLLNRQAIFWINVLEYPIYLLSGIATSIQKLPWFLQIISWLLPTKWIVGLLHQIFNAKYNILTSANVYGLLILTALYGIGIIVMNNIMERKILVEGQLEVY